MKVIRLEIDDTLFKDLKEFKHLLTAHLHEKSKQEAQNHSNSSSDQKPVAWNDITASEWDSKGSNFGQLFCQVRDRWTAVLYDVVTAIEKKEEVIELKQESPAEWWKRHWFRKVDNSLGWLIAIIAIVAAIVIYYWRSTDPSSFSQPRPF